MNARYLLAELRHRFKRSLFAILSVAIGVAIFISLQAYAEGYHRAARAPLTEIGADIVAERQGKVPEKFEGVVFPHSTAPLTREEIEDIKKLEGVEKTAEAVFFWSFEPDHFLVGLGIDPNETFGPGRLKSVVREGRYLQEGDKWTALADTSYASENQLTVGSKVRFSNHDFTIVSKMQERLGKNGLVTTPGSFEEVLGTTFQLIDRFGLLVGVAGLLIALASLIRTVTTGLWERRRDIELMRALGWRKREVSMQLMSETLAVTLAGWLLGVVISYLISWGLSFYKIIVPVPWELSPTPHFLPGGAKEMMVTVSMDAHINLFVVVLAVLISVIGVGLISLWVSRRVSNIKPAEVLRSE